MLTELMQPSLACAISVRRKHRLVDSVYGADIDYAGRVCGGRFLLQER
jgi:hypothetical protein